MSQAFEYKGYSGSVLYSAEDDLLHGKVLGIYDSITYEGSSIDLLRIDFQAAVDEYIVACQADGRQPDLSSGVALAFTVPAELRDRAEHYAELHHTDVGAVMQLALAQYLESAA